MTHALQDIFVRNTKNAKTEKLGIFFDRLCANFTFGLVVHRRESRHIIRPYQSTSLWEYKLADLSEDLKGKQLAMCVPGQT